VADVLEAIDEAGRIEEPTLGVQRELAELQIAVALVESKIERRSDDDFDPEKADRSIALWRRRRETGRQTLDVVD